MFLPDFLTFEPFNQLRRDMGAEELGDFTFFDPKRHATGLERLSLCREGLEIAAHELRVLNDFTLAYKDCRVLLLPCWDEAPPNEKPNANSGVYHLADCPVVIDLMNVDSTPLNGSLWRVHCNGEVMAAGSRVCRQCLQRLRYRDFDGVRQRHREYSERVEQAFDLNDFFKQYPSYPLGETEPAAVF